MSRLLLGIFELFARPGVLQRRERLKADGRNTALVTKPGAPSGLMVGAGQQRHVIAMLLGQRIVAGNLVLGAMRLMRMQAAWR